MARANLATADRTRPDAPSLAEESSRSLPLRAADA